MNYNNSIKLTRKDKNNVNPATTRSKTRKPREQGHGGYDVPPVDTF